MNNEVTIKIEGVRKAFHEAKGNHDIQSMLRNLFGDVVEEQKPENVMERIKTFEDALDELEEGHPLVTEFEELQDYFTRNDNLSKDVVAYLKLRIITAALNEGWMPKFTDDEVRYFPWFCIYTKEELENMSEEDRRRCVGLSSSSAGSFGGLVFASANFASSSSGTGIGYRLAFKSEELAVYAGKQFIEIWADYVFA